MLNKALNGTIEAGRLCYDMFVADTTIKFGYEVNELNLKVLRTIYIKNNGVINIRDLLNIGEGSLNLLV